jgi:hypothetical protein
MPSKQEALFKVAKECAYKRLIKKCNNKFGCSVCTECKWYIGNYIDADPRQMNLFMIEVEESAYDLHHAVKATNSAYRKFIAFVVILVLLVIGYAVKVNVNKVRRMENTPDIVWQTIEQVNSKIYDINKDGKINCQDYAIMFYNLYPYTMKLIFINDNSKTGMNHAFIAVKLKDEGWVSVESKPNGSKSYSVKDVWGSKYNKEATGWYKAAYPFAFK